MLLHRYLSVANESDKSVAKVSSRNSFKEKIQVWLKTNHILDNAESKSHAETDEKNEKCLDTRSRDKDGIFYIKLSLFLEKIITLRSVMKY